MNLRSLLSVVVATLALAGCSDRPEALLSPDTTPAMVVGSSSIDLAGVLEFAAVPDLTGKRSVSKLIRASEGGSVELNGFRVTIPAGALPQDTVITLELPRDETLAKHVLASFSPHGIQFKTPVTLTFPLDGVLLPGGTLEVGRWENGGWTSLGGTVSPDGKSLSSTTPHFSDYAARGAYTMAGG